MDKIKYAQEVIKVASKLSETYYHKPIKVIRNFSTGEEMFRWWMEENPNQVTFDDIINPGGK